MTNIILPIISIMESIIAEATKKPRLNNTGSYLAVRQKP